MFLVHQLDPSAIDRKKIAQMGEHAYKLEYPEYILPDYLLVPVQPHLLKKTNEMSQDLNIKEDRMMIAAPPRFVMINLKWNMIQTF